MFDVVKRQMFSRSVKLLLAAFFGVAVILPIVSMVSRIQWDTVGPMISTPQFGETVLNSLTVSVAATILSVLIAYLLALAINRSRIPCKTLLNVLITLPMLIPSISHGLGLINLFGANGLLTRLLGLSGEIYGFQGVLFGSVMYSFPVAFLMLSDAMKYADNSVYEAAKVLGIPARSRFTSITLHYMRRPLISAAFAVFTMVFTDYGVPLSIGGRFTTLPVYLYTNVIGLLDFSTGAMIGLILLIPAVITFLIDLRKRDNESLDSVTKSIRVEKNLPRDISLGAFCIVIVGAVLLILGSFVVMTFMAKYPYNTAFTFNHIEKMASRGMWDYFGNSLLISVLVALFGTFVAYITAYCTARTANVLVTRLLHLTSIATIAIPGIVLGLGYVICFRDTFIYGTILILVLVNIIHFFSSPYMMAHNAMKKMNANFEDVGKTLSIGRLRMLRDVFVPNTMDTIAEMFGYFFVNSMITISAVAFLYNTRTMPLSIMINQLQGDMMLEAAAFVSLVILLSNIAAKVLIGLVKHFCKR